MLLVLAGLPEPVVNLELRDGHGQVVLRLDLAYRGVKLAVEYGGRHRYTEDRFRVRQDTTSTREILMSSRRLIRPSSLALIATALLLPAGPAYAGNDVGDYCSPESGFTSKTRIFKVVKKAVVTHAFPKELAPGSKWTKSYTMQKVARVSAGITYSSEVTVGADGVIAKAEAKVGVELQASGEATRATSYTESLDIVNNTKRNRQYVVFSGTTRHSGRFGKTYCDLSDRRVKETVGGWRSWTVESSSNTTRCDLEPAGALARAAQRQYCG